MCNCKGGCGCGCNGGGMCTVSFIAKILLIIGGVNWGLIGVGLFMNSNWNVVNLLLGGMPTLESIIYILVGVAGVMSIFGCRCGKCAGGVCAPASTPTGNTGGGMGGNM